MHDSAAGFRDRVRLDEARSRLRALVHPHDRTEAVPLHAADARVLAEPVSARRAVPGYRRAAMDGYAVRAEDTFGAGDRSPAALRVADDTVTAGTAVAVHTGDPVPDGADAVVRVEETDTRDGELEVFAAVPEGENVAPVGEDVEDGQALFEAGHRLRPSDLGLLKASGYGRVRVWDRPTIGVIPTGDELVQGDPGVGEVIETNGFVVAQAVERWGGAATYRDVVRDDAEALRAAIQRDLTHDLVVTTGGSSVGDRDLVPDVVADLGELAVHGVAIQPGHPVGIGAVEGTPVLLLPGYPVSCIVTAHQLLRPAVTRAGGAPFPAPPRVTATLDGKLRSAPGVRTFARVTIDGDGEDRVATPVSAAGAGVLSSVALADGWVVIPEGREGIPAGDRVAVEDWEWSP